jgi:hypothetical protein
LEDLLANNKIDKIQLQTHLSRSRNKAFNDTI